MSMGNYLSVAPLVTGTMATNRSTAGMDHPTVVPDDPPELGVDHPTVVPENYDPDADV